MRKMYSKKQIEEIAKSSGTKLYKHLIEDNNNGYFFILITTNNQPINFSIITNSSELNNYLQTENVITFTGDGGVVIYDGSNKPYFYRIDVIVVNNTPTCKAYYYEDWDFTSTTDTVSEL